jgi:hypothetical protein
MENASAPLSGSPLHSLADLVKENDDPAKGQKPPIMISGAQGDIGRSSEMIRVADLTDREIEPLAGRRYEVCCWR